MADLTDVLSGHARLGLDTAVFIYHLEQNPRYSALTHALLSGVEAGRWTACTSVVTLIRGPATGNRGVQPLGCWRTTMDGRNIG